MLIAEALLAELNSLGVTAETDGSILRLRPASLLSPQLVELARERKPELVALVSARQLESRILAVLGAGEVHSTRSLALRLGLPAPKPTEGGPLYDALGALLERRAIATDPKTCTFRAAPPEPPPPDHPTKGDAP